MPTYDYRCDACGNEFSATQRYGEEPLAACPRCGARPRRLVSRPAIVFKGSGWHATDYRPKSADAASGDGATAKDTGKKDPPKPAPAKKEDAPGKPDTSAPNS